MTDHQEHKIFKESKGNLLQHLWLSPVFFGVTQDNLARTYWWLRIQWTQEWTGRCGKALFGRNRRGGISKILQVNEVSKLTASLSDEIIGVQSAVGKSWANWTSDWNYMRILLFQACWCKTNFILGKKKKEKKDQKEDSDATRISVSKHMLFWRQAKASDLGYV